MLTFFSALSAAFRRHALLFLFLLTAAALTLLARDWLAQHDARLKLESALAAQQKIVTDAGQRQSARDAQLSQTLSQIAALKKSVQTPQQSAAAINHALQQLLAASPGRTSLPAPIQIDLPPTSSTNSTRDSSTSANNSSASNPSTLKSQVSNDAAPILSNLKSQISNMKLPSGSAPPSPQGISQQGSGQQGSAPSATPQPNSPPPATLRIPQDDLKPLFDALEDCQSCQAQLSAAHGDLLDERAKSTALAAQRDAALQSARGTLWTRLRHNAKWFAIGAAAGALLARYH